MAQHEKRIVTVIGATGAQGGSVRSSSLTLTPSGSELPS
jgi:hypothetical protein